MKRWGLAILLLLSIGLNVGLVGRHLWRPSPPQPSMPAADVERNARPADRVGQPPARRLGRMIEHMADDLELDGDQRQRFIELQRQYFDRTFRARREQRSARRLLHANLQSTTPDQAAADRQLETMARAEHELEQAFVDNFFASRQLLDERQERRFRHFLAKVRRQRDAIERRWARDKGSRQP